MPIHETGHDKNIANFNTLNTYLASLAKDYQPSKASIQLSNLQKLWINAKDAAKKLSDSASPYSTAVDAQEAVFKPFNKLLTRVIKALRASVDDEAEAETAESFRQKIAGERPKKPKVGDEPGSETHSTSQRSYDNQVKNFNQLISTLKSISAYAPNEPELTIASLEALAADMDKKVTAVDTIQAPMINARIARNKVLYTPKTGIVELVDDVKSYIGSVYGATSPELKFIQRLKFSKNKL